MKKEPRIGRQDAVQGSWPMHREDIMGFSDAIGAIVQRDTPALTLDEGLSSAITKMASCGCCAMVVKKGEELVGIVTDMDLLDSVAKNNDLETTTVAQVMSPCELITGKGSKSPCVQLDAEQNVKNALGVMNAAGTRHLLVSGPDDKAVGLVSACDLLALALR